MAEGPGKYDAAATQVRIETGARAVVVIVLEGRDGSGFSVQTDPTLLNVTRVVALLRSVADVIEQGLN